MQIPPTFHYLSVSRIRDGEWQANLMQRGESSFRVRFGATPTEAIEALFALPKVPPCPVGAPFPVAARTEHHGR